MEDNNLDQKIAQIQAKFPLRSRRECEETLEVVDDDVDKALAFLEYLGPRVPTIQTQDASVTANTQKQISAQGGAGGQSHAGQKGVLDLSTMEWTPGEGNPRSRALMPTITAPLGPSGQTGPQIQMPSDTTTSSVHKACTMCNHKHRFCIHYENGDVDPVREMEWEAIKAVRAMQRSAGAKKFGTMMKERC